MNLKIFPYKCVPQGHQHHFHQKKIVQRYITMKPKLDASKDLKKIVSRLTQTTEKNFTNKFDEWYEIYKEFLEEKSVSSTTGELHYTHPRIRAAYRSLRTNLPYLLTYKNYKYLSISNTTNTILDRLLYHSHVINILGDSYRLKEKKEEDLVDSDLYKFQIKKPVKGVK